MPVRKKPRTQVAAVSDAPAEDTNPVLQAKVMCQLVNEQGENTGAQVLLPLGATKDQLQQLLWTLVAEHDPEAADTPHAFFLGEDQISDSLAEVVHKQQKDAVIDKMLAEGRRVRPQDRDAIPLEAPEETVLRVTYKPQAVFKVRPLTRCSTTLDGHSEAVLIVAFSPDSKILATGGGDKEIRLWDVNTMTPTDTLKGHPHWVQVLSWSPDGSFLVSGSRDGTLLEWRHDAEYTNFVSRSLKGHANFVTHVAWEPQHINPACDRFVSASKDMFAKVWKVGIGMLFSLAGHTAGLTCVKWGGNKRIFTSSQDKTIMLWNSDDGAPLNQLKGHAHWVNFLALNTDLVIRTGVFDHTEKTFASKEEATAYAKERYDAVITRSKGERLVSCSDDNTMFLWDPERSQPLTRMTGHQGVIFHIAFSPDGSMIASCGADKSVKLWNAVDGKFITTFRGHVGSVYHVSWSLDSRMLVSGSRDSTLKLWSATTKKLVEDLSGHADEIFSTDWSPDGQRVATGSKDKKVRIWVH